jgi:DNA-binding CsgD family transcriptional regulator/tetratricopeptide (TPR) repeat protein
MAGERELIGRDELSGQLARTFTETAMGRGGLLLLAGEAGVGKTRVARHALERSELLTLHVSAGPAIAVAFGPIVSALRGFLRIAPGGLPLDDKLGRYLPLLLPELGPAPPPVDRATLFETVLDAFRCLARREPTIVFLDDIHEADHATLELLPYLGAALAELPLLVLAAYRADELRRDHPLRRLRSELRRANRLRELVVDPLGAADTASLASRILGGQPSADLASALYERTEGIPLFIEEMLAALATAGGVRDAGGIWQLSDPAALLPVPDSVRDLVLLRTAALSDEGRAAVEVAAVAGVRFDLDLVAPAAGDDDSFTEAFAHGLLVETDNGGVAFRHALVRDALYSDIAWPRRRALHRRLAERLEARGAAPSLLAEHWLAGRETERARRALLLALDAACAVHAYRDAAALAQRTLELWPEAEREAERIGTLDRLGQCAQLSGDLATAITAWRQVIEAHKAAGDTRRYAEALRRFAGACELQGTWEQALAARKSAASAFVSAGQPGEAAAEHLGAATHLRAAMSFGAALQLLEQATVEAREAGRVDLQARILGLGGGIRARMGQYEVGVDLVRKGLALALEHNSSGAAAEVYQRLADALEHAGDYRAARDTYQAAADFCEGHGAGVTAQLCRACMTVVLRQTGEWERCMRVCGEVIAAQEASAHARSVALGMLGLVRAMRGEGARARQLLLESSHLATHIELAAMELLSVWGLALVDELDGNVAAAVQRGRAMLERWARTEDRHFSIQPLRWATSMFATQGADADARACASALALIVSETGAAEAVAALGHALGELSLLDGDVARAARSFTEAADRLAELDLPYDRAHTRLRAGVALVAAGERDRGLEQLVNSYHGAHALGARALASAVARELALLGEPIAQRLGRRAAGLYARGGLTRRELEVLRLVAEGHTDRGIGQLLVLSPRTVEMHVANCLGKLGCRSRAEAVHRAGQLRLLATTSSAT